LGRVAHTRARDRQLGVDHWDSPDLAISRVHFFLGSEPPLVFRGDLKRPGSFVDMRIYLGRLLGDFAARGGPEGVIDLVEARASDGFDDLDAVARHAEREAIVRGYASLAGYAQDQVNRRHG
jgi:hypothetical protein